MPPTPLPPSSPESLPRATVVLPNRRRVQNHLGGVHACGIALAAESASGCVFGMNLAPSQLPLLKSMAVAYRKRSMGDLVAVATLTPEQRELMATQPRGEVTVAVAVTDSISNANPVECTMVWAWVPRPDKSAPAKAKL